MRLWIILFGVAALASAPARGEVSRQWKEYADQTNAECTAFRQTRQIVLLGAPKLEAWNRVTWPYAPARPHICIFAEFDIDPAGVPENVEIVHVSPDNIQYRFKREAMLTVKELRFETANLSSEGFRDMWIEVTYDACGPKLRDRCIGLNFPSRE